MKKDEFKCCHAIGNGGGAYKCKFTGLACPYQRWCHLKRLFEFKSTASNCKDFK